MESKPPVHECASEASRSDGKRDYSPRLWSDYFDTSKDIEVSTSNIFRVYAAGAGPLLFVLIHGGGMCAQTWSLVTSKLKADFEVLALDLRGHGATRTSNDSDLSADTLVADVVGVVNAYLGGRSLPIILVGHSLGGAVAARVAHSPQLAVDGLVVVDVVEGTAISALKFMHGVISSRPTSFPDLSSAVEWSLKSGMVRNVESARVSAPPQFVSVEGKQQEDGTPVGAVRWRTDLMSTAPFWEGWFQGLSEIFLKAKASKVLVLAGTDRLDKALTVAQMQGKFQLKIIPDVGHCVHEDNPDMVADFLGSFAKRIAQIASFNKNLNAGKR
jgi:protein phosphatase methylesterase 1